MMSNEIIKEGIVMNISICDDDREFVSQLENMIVKYLDEHNYRADIQIFLRSEELIEYVENEGNMDLLFLDIEFDESTGIEIGKSIRDNYNNDSVQIVFVSCKEHYAMQLFDIRPFNFLVKPVEYNKLSYVMDEFNRLFDLQQTFFEYHIGKQQFRINEQSILYFESKGKKINMVTTTGIRQFYGKLSEVNIRLLTKTFCTVHKSFIINTRYVTEYGREQVTMTNGDVIPISRSMRAHLNEKIITNEWGTK